MAEFDVATAIVPDRAPIVDSLQDGYGFEQVLAFDLCGAPFVVLKRLPAGSRPGAGG
jgi:hypothetical protein